MLGSLVNHLFDIMESAIVLKDNVIHGQSPELLGTLKLKILIDVW